MWSNSIFTKPLLFSAFQNLTYSYLNLLNVGGDMHMEEDLCTFTNCYYGHPFLDGSTPRV